METKKHRYEIAGYLVEMTEKQAEIWNEGFDNFQSLRGVLIYIPEPNNQSKCYTLAEFCRSEKRANELCGYPANPVN